MELFLDTDGSSDLETWRFYRAVGKHTLNGPIRFSAAPAHRRIYLEFTGNISGDRGKLRILRRGKFIDRRSGMFKASAAHEMHFGSAQEREARRYIRVTL